MDSQFLDELSNLDSGSAVSAETWKLSPELFGNELWMLRVCYIPEASPALLGVNFEELNVVALNAKAIAGRMHILAGANAMVRDFQAKRAVELSKNASAQVKSQEVKNKISVHLPQSLYVRKHNSGVSFEALFAPVASQGVFLVSISDVPEETDDPITSLIEQYSLAPVALSLNEPDLELLRRAYDLGEAETCLAQVDKAVCSRVAARDCL